MTRAEPRVMVIGGGLAGSEAAWQAARLGARVTLYEMRPEKPTEAHKTAGLAELVCSNSFKSDRISNANGLLKVELKMLGSLLMEVAGRARVPAGSALCVDRDAFASEVTERIAACERINLVRLEAQGVAEDAVTVLAPGPLASAAISRTIETMVGARNLSFYDAISPIVEAGSIDMTKVYMASRYDKGDSTYINLPLDRDLYFAFLDELRRAERVERRAFERSKFFSACMPIEELARKGDETLAHGCMKPVGLPDPRTGKIPYAVVQLRPENLAGNLYGMVGFQTRLTYGEQRRILRMLPGLESARFARLGSVHRNTFINAPVALHATLRHRRRSTVFYAGQITGAEGYVAAMATGLMAGLNAAVTAWGGQGVVPPRETMIGSLMSYLSEAPPDRFQPMNPNFGLLPSLGVRLRDRQRRNLLLSERSVLMLKPWLEELGLACRCGGALSQSGSVH